MPDEVDLGAALEEAIAAKERIWPKVRLDYCPGCKGAGRVYTTLALGGGERWVECWDCGGTGEGDPDDEKDISHDE